ncbi:MAG: type IV pilus assembly protein PilM [Candidatus Omnitrophica bacterium]|nr:type IV pilus assembly protein PilM [Candidatus Omnitrophota bacterium]
MNDKHKDKIDDIVKSKIKGLGLDALFHQVDITQKDEQKKSGTKPNTPDDELQLIKKISQGVPLKYTDRLSRFIDNFLANINAQKTDNQIIIDIGSSSIKILILKYEKQNITLQDAIFIPVPNIITNTVEKLNNFTKKSILPFTKNLLFKNSKINTLLSRSTMIVKFISLPTIQKHEIEKMLVFEAEQHLPFPLSEIEMDYNILSQESPESKIILIAAKKSLIKDHLDLLETLNLYPDSIKASSIALYNCSLSKNRKQGIYLQVHIGATYTDINIINNNQLSFCRNITWGSKDLTLRLSKNLNLSFDNAQKLKHENGIIITKQDTNEIQKNISSISTKWADDLILEINRTLESFQINTGKIDIQQLNLSGGGACLINFNEYLREKLKVKIVMEKPLTFDGNPAVINNYEKHAQEFQLCTGLIKKEPNTGYLNLNLVPEDIKHAKKAKNLKIKQITYIAVCLFALISLFALPAWLLSLNNNRLKALDKQLQALEPDLLIVSQLKDRIQTIEDYVGANNSCMEILREISIIAPYDIMIDNFTFEKNESVILSGIAQSHSSVVNFSQLLNDSSFFADVKILFTRKKGLPGEEIIDFEIISKIKNKEAN